MSGVDGQTVDTHGTHTHTMAPWPATGRQFGGVKGTWQGGLDLSLPTCGSGHTLHFVFITFYFYCPYAFLSHFSFFPFSLLSSLPLTFYLCFLFLPPTLPCFLPLPHTVLLPSFCLSLSPLSPSLPAYLPHPDGDDRDKDKTRQDKACRWRWSLTGLEMARPGSRQTRRIRIRIG